MANILIVEDEKAINELIRKNLQLVGYRCACAYNGVEAIDWIEENLCDLIILDIMLPKLDGFEAKKIVGDIPVIFLTAKDSLSDRMNGFSLGADDYIIKPFEMQELLARIQAVLRRTKKERTEYCLDNIYIDFDAHQVFMGDSIIECTPKEFELIRVLVANRNIALSRERLLELVWGYDYVGDTRTIDVHIQKLRTKLGWEERIKTVYKVGYRLEDKS